MNKVTPLIEWRDIKGFEGFYQVSNLGEVKSLDRIITHKDGKRYQRKGVLLSKSITSTGYYKVELSNDDIKSKSYKVHRLVAKAFVFNTFNKPFVNHKDGNPLNNIVDNLEWCTQQENVIHAIETGLRKTTVNTRDTKLIIKDYLNGVGPGDILKKHGITKGQFYEVLEYHKTKHTKMAIL